MYYPQNNHCPCGSSEGYAVCCGVYHQAVQYPETAECLMRSRFSAFYVGSQSMSTDERYLMADYLLLTTIEDDAPFKDTDDRRKQLIAAFSQQKWLSLRILSSGGYGDKTVTAVVTFVAFYHLPHQAATEVPAQLHEMSRFKRVAGRWLYIDGDIKSPVKLRPNEPCWCGSLIKYKKCHG